jgi:hypothetical protein
VDGLASCIEELWGVLGFVGAAMMMDSMRISLDADFASDPRVEIFACDSHRCPCPWSGGLNTVGFQVTALNCCGNRWSTEACVFRGGWPGEVCGLGFVRSSRMTFAVHSHRMCDYRL